MDPISAVIGGGASLLSQAFNAFSQNKTNKRQERFAREMYAKQRADSLSDWNMQNAYNDPSAQMSRLQNAGLNPHLVYGNGADAQSQGAPKPVSSHSANFRPPQMDFGSVISNALNTKQLQSNIAQTDAQTDLIKQNTEAKKFDNQIRENIGLDRYVNQLDVKMRSANSTEVANIMQFDSDFRAYYAYKGDEMADKHVLADNKVNWNNSLMIKAKQAGVDKLVQDVENAKKLGILRNDQHSLNLIEQKIRDFQGNLTKLGVSPTTIQGLAVFTTILKTLFGK